MASASSPAVQPAGPDATAIIGGTGLNSWPDFELIGEHHGSTPYGEPSAPLQHGRIDGAEVLFLARHGSGHALPPHRINARANLWALKQAGVRRIVAIASVGGIAQWMAPASVAVPIDLIDYTWGREHTFHDGRIGALTDAHVDMTHPYAPPVRAALLEAARRCGMDCHDGGVMAVTQGPRLETPAEIRRLRRDGCDMVGMTGIPETALARELGIDYATLAVSINWAAGLSPDGIHDAIDASIRAGMARVHAIVRTLLADG